MISNKKHVCLVIGGVLIACVAVYACPVTFGLYLKTSGSTEPDDGVASRLNFQCGLYEYPSAASWEHTVKNKVEMRCHLATGQPSMPLDIKRWRDGVGYWLYTDQSISVFEDTGGWRPDDESNDDEDLTLSALNNIYSEDKVGLPGETPDMAPGQLVPGDKMILLANFEEYVQGNGYTDYQATKYWKSQSELLVVAGPTWPGDPTDVLFDVIQVTNFASSGQFDLSPLR